MAGLSGAFGNPVGRWRAENLGAWPAMLLCSGTAAICLAATFARTLPHPWFETIPSQGLFWLISLASAVAALAVFRSGRNRYAVSIITAFWIAAAIASGTTLARSGAVTAAVALSEAVVLAVAFLVLFRPSGKPILLAAIAAMLALFGGIHLIYSDAVAALIHEDFPMRTTWPLVTGTVMIAAAGATLVPKLRRYGLAAVAAMFTAWLPLVHLPRLLTEFSVDEINFAATAIALIGALLVALASPPEEARDAFTR